VYFIQRIDNWAEKHHPMWIDFLRILLGLTIFYKGIYFIVNSSAFVDLLRGTSLEFLSYFAVHFVIAVHVLGGLLIAFGLLTRFAAIIQIPILAGALLFVNLPNSLKAVNFETELSAIVLFLLLFILVEGSGPLSVDAYLSKHPEE
jgi:uncharacterized membrane protein YphA (DoxX/SURF4 family)